MGKLCNCESYLWFPSLFFLTNLDIHCLLGVFVLLASSFLILKIYLQQKNIDAFFWGLSSKLS